jgi:hypothetical protein
MKGQFLLLPETERRSLPDVCDQLIRLCILNFRRSEDSWGASENFAVFVDIFYFVFMEGILLKSMFIGFVECRAGLPDGIFSNQKSQLGYNYECTYEKIAQNISQPIFFVKIDTEVSP